MRLFFAIPLPETVLDAVSDALRPLRPLATDIGWTRRANLHLTLRFVGEVPEDQVDALADAAAPWVRLLPPPPLRLVGGGAFPDANRPKVLWLGIDGALEPLAAALDNAVAALGYPREERRFSPHLTVGRVRAGRADKLAAAMLELGEIASFTADSVVLYQSHLSPEGARYEAIRTFPVA